MEQTIRRAVARSGADYTDVRVERSQRTEIRYQKERLEALQTSAEFGGVVRCLVGGGWGLSVFNDLSTLDRRIAEAIAAARLVGGRTDEPVRLADAPVVEDRMAVGMEEDLRRAPLATKKELIESYNAIALAGGEAIVSSDVRYRDSFREVTFANSEGSFIVQEIPDVAVLIGAFAGDGRGNIQFGFETSGGAGGLELARGHDEAARTAASRAIAMLSARPVHGGSYTVVLDPTLAGVFIHEAFGHFCEADFLFRNPQLREIMTIGTEFGSPELNVIDAGFVPGRRGNVPYDDEGVLRRTTYLIRDGRLAGHLHSRETAHRMGAEPTGNARAISYEHEPIVRMRNTYIERGTSPFAEMIRGIDRGIYACRAYGGETEFEQFSFSAGYAHEIVDGEIGEMVRDVVLTGNLFETLRSIDRIGDDLVLEGGFGGCGKGGQHPLAVTTGAPHVRIRNVTIGGA